ESFLKECCCCTTTSWLSTNERRENSRYTKRDCSALNWAIKGEERNHQEYHQPHNCRICPKGGPRCIKKSEGSTDL
ncbi:Os09g0515400, partial [Oryza sativa Japonica Group]